MIKMDKANSQPVQSLLPSLLQIFHKLNTCLPYSQQIPIQPSSSPSKLSLSSLCSVLNRLTDKILESIKSYQKILQNMQQNMRKHIKNQIELKLYYEHLEEIITNFKKEQQGNAEIINGLKTEITVLKEREKYFLTVSNNNTKNYDEGFNFQNKLDTIAKIKNRLSLNGTQEFYNNYIAKKLEKDQDTKQLRDKRQSLANTLKQLYQSPGNTRNSKFIKRSKLHQQQHDRSKQKCGKKSNGKSKQKQKQKQKQKKDSIIEHQKSRSSLNKARSGKSLNSSHGSQKYSSIPHRNQSKMKQGENQKNYLKGKNHFSSHRQSNS